MLRSLAPAAVLAATLALAPSAHAHRSFLVPSSTVLSGGASQWVSVDAARGNDLFFFNHNAMPVDGLVITAPDGSTVAPAKLERFRYRAVFDWQLTQPGTWRAAVLDEGLRATWEDQGKPGRWAGTRADFAKAVPAGAAKLAVAEVHSRVETYVTSGKPTAPPRSGKGMEVVYQPHPNDLVEGDTATLTFLVDGKPARALPVRVARGGARYRNQNDDMTLTTDETGKVKVTWPASGLYWVNASLRREATAPATRASVSYAATLEVMPR